MANIITEAKEFAQGSMDSDSAFDKIRPNDYVDAVNIRTTGSAENEDGDVTAVESNVLVSPARRSGVNTNVGSQKFKTLRMALSLYYNSQGYDIITQYNYDTGVETTIFEDITDTGGKKILNLNPEKTVNDIKVLHGKFMVFTDGNQSVKCINLDRLKSKKYGVVRLEDIELAKAQPLKVPVFVYGNDSGRSANLMREKLFQFREQWEYQDYELSTWGTISKREVPTDEPSPSAATNVSKNNHAIVSVDAGTDRVHKVNIAARYGLLDWFLVKSIEREYIVTLPNIKVNVDEEIVEAYDPATNIYSFAFYNDGLYPNIDVLETDESYDAIPDLAESLEVVNGSILALAGITEGHDRPTTDFELDVTYYDPGIEVVPTDQSNVLRVIRTNSDRISNSHKRGITIYFAGSPKLGDKITITTADITNSTKKREYSYTALLADVGNLDRFIEHLFTAAHFERGWPDYGSDRIYFEDISYYSLQSAIITLQNSSTGETKSIPALKGNSSYQTAIRYYDRKGKYFPLVSGRKHTANTKSIAQTSGLLPQIGWKIIDEKAPEGAVSYQILLSANNTHQKSLYVNVKAAQSNGNYVELILDSLKDFNDRNPSSVLNYEYTEGDRVTFVNFSLAILPNNLIYFNNPPIDVQVVGYEIRVTPATDTVPAVTNYILKIAKSSQIYPEAFQNANVLIELYTPNKRLTVDANGDDVQSENLWYEIGEQYDIVDGRHTVMSGTIRRGDSYYKNREYALATNDQELKQYMVEDFNFSDYYPSAFSSIGRGGTYYDEPGKVFRGASIRTAEPSEVGNKINGINRFYASRIYGDGDGQTSIDYGAIYKIMMRDSTLVCFQETKVCHIPVFKSYIADLEERTNVAISSRLFNQAVYPPSGSFGIGKKKESFAMSEKGVMYFVDPSNAVPVRDGYDGIKPIPGLKAKYFQRVIQQANADGSIIHGIFDDDNNEYIVAIQSKTGAAKNFTFSEDKFRYKEDYVINKLTLQFVSSRNGTLAIDTGAGTGVFTPTSGFTGKAGFTFSYLVNGIRVAKNVCIDVLAGTNSIVPFSFPSLYDQLPGQQFVSGSIKIEGNANPVAISISNGSYRVNGGDWKTASGTVGAGDSVQVRVNTGSAFDTDYGAVLSVSDYQSAFVVRTKVDPNQTVYIWGNIELQDQEYDPVTDKYFATVMLRTYRTNTQSKAPEPKPSNAISLTLSGITIVRRTLQNTSSILRHTVDMVEQVEIRINPLSAAQNPKYPKHIVRDAVNDYYFTFPGLEQGQMFLLKTI